MRLRWSPRAIDDLREIRRYIGRENPAAAKQVADRIKQVVRLLPDHPEIGRPGRVPGTRELVVTGTRYIVPYAVIARDRIELLAVMHTSRKWPKGF
jgi:toxin ParE1/3/4